MYCIDTVIFNQKRIILCQMFFLNQLMSVFSKSFIYIVFLTKW